MHIILVHVVRSQNQHFAKMFTYSDNTNYSLLYFYCFNLIEISFIPVPDVSGEPRWAIRVLTITAPSFDETSEFASCGAVVDMRSLCRHEKPLQGECNVNRAYWILEVYHFLLDCSTWATSFVGLLLSLGDSPGTWEITLCQSQDQGVILKRTWSTSNIVNCKSHTLRICMSLTL
jgi:hypothetical protein